MGFTKLDDGLVFSSVMAEDDAVFKCWIIILSLTRADGISPISTSFLSRITKKDEAEVERCLNVLRAPDKRSRTKEHEGRRIEDADGGFRVLNYHKYREETTREYERDRKRRQRSGQTSQEDGYVYFVGFADRVKIGFSKNPHARLADLKTSIPDAKLLGYVKATVDYETQLHNDYATLRIEREWFKMEGALRQKINELLGVVPDYGGSSPGPSASASGSRSSTKSTKKPKKQKTTDPADRFFDAFWDIYPRKEGKAAARKAWAKIKKPGEIFIRIAEALVWQRASEQWTREGGQFIPHPSTYLNAGRWDDERPPDQGELPIYRDFQKND